MYVIIVGGGQTGEILAKTLVAENEDVVIIEQDDERAEELADELDALIIKGDGTNAKIMKDAGIDRADAIAALTNDDNVNLMICHLAKKAEVGKIAARVNNPANETLFIQAGVDGAISVTSSIVSDFMNSFRLKGAKTAVTLAGGKMELLELYLTDNSPAVGKAANKCGLPKDSKIVVIERKEDIILVQGDETLNAGDLLWITAKSKAAPDVIKSLVK
ncbi:MAG: NAD-binding protein [archaeon]